MFSHSARIRRRPALRAHLARNITKAKENYITQSLIQTIIDFCKETSIHGCRFIFEDIEDTGSPHIRRFRRAVSLVVWLTFDLLGFVFAIFLMILIWNRFQNTPTMTTVETNNYPIWNVPFPGVTICNVNAVYKPNTRHLAYALKKRGFSTDTVELYFENLAALVNYEEVDSQFLSISHALEEMGYTTERVMFELAHPCEKLFRHCSWLGQHVSCKNLFRMAKSAEGFCCSFNYKALRSQFEMNFRRAASFFLWLTVVCVGLVFGIFLMVRVWGRFQITPTITTIETNNYPIWNIAFPGVTICNVNAVYRPSTKNLSRALKESGFSRKQIDSFFENLDALVNYDIVDSEFVKIFGKFEEWNYTTSQLMYEVAQPCESFLKLCEWQGKMVPCNSIFRMAKSSSGFCCSFNYKALRSSLEIETKADDYYQINTPVIRISGAGEDVGLRVLLDVETEEYVAPKRFFYGAEVIIHDPEDFPEKSLLTAFGQPGLEVSIAVMPSVVVTEKSVESLPVNLRFCRFSHEKRLQITKKYSFQSCITECRAKTVLQKCGCLPFFYPPVYYDNNTNYRQCTLKDVKCLSDNKHFFASLEPPSEMYYVFNTTNIGMNCDCLPSCTEQTYNVETFISQRLNDVKTASHFNNTDITNSTLIKVYFKDLSCIKYRREIFMTWDDLLASFGGIFGLCLGGSVLSLVEIAYYATFKLYAKILSNKAKLKKQKQEQFAHSFIMNFNKTRLVPSVSKAKLNEEFLW